MPGSAKKSNSLFAALLRYRGWKCADTTPMRGFSDLFQELARIVIAIVFPPVVIGMMKSNTPTVLGGHSSAGVVMPRIGVAEDREISHENCQKRAI
jgi:hypothetical protein